MKRRFRRAAMIAGCVSATLACRTEAAVGLSLDNLGSSSSVATVAAGSVFSLSAYLNETSPADQVTGADYEISSSTSGIVQLLGRNSSGGTFSSPNGFGDAYLSSSPYSPRVLNPTNGTNLGTSLADSTASVAGPASSDLADFSFRVLPGTPAGIYTLNFAGYGVSANPTYLGPPPNYATMQLSSTAPFILVVYGRIDVTNKNLIVKGARTAGLSAATTEAALGYDLPAGGDWSGTTGIVSSTAAADPTHTTAVGVILNNVNGTQLFGGTLGTFDGVHPGPDDVLIKYTYFGDANLDGKVDGSDYSLIDHGYTSAGPLTGWYNGDFNYDGVVDGSDYALIDNAYNRQRISLSTSTLVAAPTGLKASVPEPAALWLSAAIAVGAGAPPTAAIGLRHC